MTTKLVNGQRVAMTAQQVSDFEAARTPTFAKAKVDKKRAIDRERERRVYLPIGAVDVRGDATLMVEPDIRNEDDRDNLVALHTKALSLREQGVTDPVIPFGAADNNEYDLTPSEMIKVSEAPFDRASALYVTARVKKAAVDALTTVPEVQAYDVTAGWA